jgi:glucosamine kinase
MAVATRLVLAVDGGQSAIRLRYAATDETIELDGVSRGGDTGRAVADAVERGWRQVGAPAIDRAVLGLTTAPAERAAAAALAGFIGERIGAHEVWVTDDAVTSHAGGLSLGWGVGLVAGTGVACLAVPEHGEPRILGGHGYLLGDEGGAFWIGRRGIRAVLRAREGRASPTALTPLVHARFGALEDVHVRLHDDDRAVNAIAHFAPDVLDAADGDAVAARIVAEAADALSALLDAAVRVARGPGEDVVAIALGGRLLDRTGPLRAALDARLADHRTIAPRTADGSSLDGAMLLGTAPDAGRYAGLVGTWSRDARR